MSNEDKGVVKYEDDAGSNSPDLPCYDCGSTIPFRDTPLCEMAEEGSIQDLPQKPGTQYWTGELPETKVSECSECGNQFVLTSDNHCECGTEVKL